jgi:hypothetical protein
MSSPKHFSVCILYGLCEGPAIGRKFIRLLLANGYTITNDPRFADLIIAHSGGCLVLPNNCEAKLILLIGLPDSQYSLLRVTLVKKIKLDAQMYYRDHIFGQWLYKTFWHTVYFWNMANNWHMLHGLKTHARYDSGNAVLIRNRDDITASDDPKQLHIKNMPLLSLTGQHDDCWLHPEKYLAIIQAYYGQRLLAQTDEEAATL